MANAVGAALVLAGCGDVAEDDGSEETVAAALEADGEPDDNGSGDASSDDGEADPEEAPPAPAEELVAEDGWNGDLHDLAFPGPGQGILQVAGETIEMEVTCDASGVLDDHGYLLFWFQASGVGEDAEGRDVRASISRRIVDTEEASKTVYDYQDQERGSTQITVAIGDGQSHSSIIVTPGDDDSGGSDLPVVRVEDTGRFTVDEEVPPFASMHDQALSGPAQFSGECPETWPEDASI